MNEVNLRELPTPLLNLVDEYLNFKNPICKDIKNLVETSPIIISYRDKIYPKLIHRYKMWSYSYERPRMDYRISYLITNPNINLDYRFVLTL